MEKADNLSVWYNKKMKALKIEEGQWRWKRHKQSRQFEVEKEDLDAKKSEVSFAAKQMARKKIALMKSCDSLQRKAVELGTVSAKLVADKKVVPSTHCNSNFLFACFPCVDSTSFAAYHSQTLLKRNAKIDAFRRVWNQRRKQANKKLQRQSAELTSLRNELCKVRYLKGLFILP